MLYCEILASFISITHFFDIYYHFIPASHRDLRLFSYYFMFFGVALTLILFKNMLLTSDFSECFTWNIVFSIYFTLNTPFFHFFTLNAHFYFFTLYSRSSFSLTLKHSVFYLFYLKHSFFYLFLLKRIVFYSFYLKRSVFNSLHKITHSFFICFTWNTVF